MTVWFTSDIHFGHRLVADHRGFKDDTQAHDETIIENWVGSVRKDDIIWVLGDLTLHSPGPALEIIRDLPGRKQFIAGNHDACHPMHREAHRHQARFLEVFESVQPFARQKWSGQTFLLSHFPYERDRGEARYMQYRLPDHGEYLIHGHTHGQERFMGREIHVGLDAWDLAPVSLETILKGLNDL
jgi:calcineurin-like phosphoesterase family protein